MSATRPAVATTSPSQQVRAGAVGGGQLGDGTSNIRFASTAPAMRADHLGGGVGADLAAGQAGAGPSAEQPVGGGDDRVEVGAGDRPEQQDEHGQPEHRRGGVLQQLQPDVVGREPLGGDAGADDDGDEQPGAEYLGDQPPSEGCRRQHGRRPTVCEDAARSV